MKFIVLSLLVFITNVCFAQSIDWSNLDSSKLNSAFIKEVSKKRGNSNVQFDKGLEDASNLHSLYLSLYRIPAKHFTKPVDNSYLGHLQLENKDTKTFKQRLVYTKFKTGDHVELCSMNTLSKEDTYDSFVDRLINGFMNSKLGHKEFLLNKKYKYVSVTSTKGMNGYIYTVVVFSSKKTDVEKVSTVRKMITSNSTGFDELMTSLIKSNDKSVKKGWGTKQSKRELLENATRKHEIIKSNSLPSNMSDEMYMICTFALHNNSYTEKDISETFERMELFYNSLK